MASVEDEQPSSSSVTFSKEEVNKLMSQGKRHFVCNEIVEAVKCFESVCLMLNKKYGALSNECGEAHFQYGKSLLELARLEGGVLGNALNDAVEQELPESDEDNMVTEDDTVPTASTESNTDNKLPTIAENSDAAGETKTNIEMSAKDSTEKVETNTEEKMEEGKTESKEGTIKDEKTENTEEKPAINETSQSGENKMGENITEENKTVVNTSSDNKDTTTGEQNKNKDVCEDANINNKETTSEEQKEIDECGSKNEDEKEDGKEQNDNKDNKDEDDDVDDDETDYGPVSTIQLAWETLELARIIFKRHSNTEMQLKLAQTHLLLGEIHMEQEQFSDAISELTKCLNIQKNLLKPDDRLLAETYYNLGLGYTLSMKYEESANHYGNAIEVLELRIKNIKARIEEAEQQDKGKGKASGDDPIVKDRKELTEIEELLPEIQEKCLDAKNEGEKLKSNIAELKLGLQSVMGSSSSTCSTSSSDKPANDISHLVRKRKPKEEEETADAPVKKARQEETSQEEGSTMQTENGDSNMAETTDVEGQS